MKKRKKKNAITLLALVITIVIMLLLAGVAIQMTMGENGLIAKSVQAQKEQAKAELYDTAKLSYMSLNAKALENGQPSQQAELALSTTEFTNKYNVVGDDITDKKGTVIDTKENVLKAIMGEIPGSTTTGGSVTPGTTPVPSTPAESWPKTVAGVTIPEEEKNDMIIKLKVIGAKAKIYFSRSDGKIIDYGTGNHTERADGVEFYNGEHIIKISKFESFTITDREEGDYEVEILQWGKKTWNPVGDVKIYNVSKVYEPEPDKVAIRYVNAKFTEIPEWLFSKKITSENMSKFYYCTGLTSIPEGLFKNNVNVTEFNNTFYCCEGLTSIPEGLFKNNIKVKKFMNTFLGCGGLTSIPEGLFKNNVSVTEFYGTFLLCPGLTSIPEGLFKNNVNVREFIETFRDCPGLTSIPEGLFNNNVNVTGFVGTFKECKGLTSIPEGLFKNNVNAKYFSGFEECKGLTSIPEGLFKNNVNATNFRNTFKECKGLTSIPEGLFKNNVNAEVFENVFYDCPGLTSIPEGLFKNNVNAKVFERVFYDCEGLTSIPEGLFKNNVNAVNFISAFSGCRGLTSIPEKIIEFGKKVKEKGGNVSNMFFVCTSASNYNSLPNYLKQH